MFRCVYKSSALALLDLLGSCSEILAETTRSLRFLVIVWVAWVNRDLLGLAAWCGWQITGDFFQPSSAEQGYVHKPALIMDTYMIHTCNHIFTYFLKERKIVFFKHGFMSAGNMLFKYSHSCFIFWYDRIVYCIDLYNVCASQIYCVD